MSIEIDPQNAAAAASSKRPNLPRLNDYTKKSVTASQKAKLLRAVELAQMPGFCVYLQADDVGGVEPSCVIGQLAVLEGVRISALQTWIQSSAFDHLWIGSPFNEEIERLQNYDVTMLSDLQRIWDRGFVGVKVSYAGIESYMSDDYEVLERADRRAGMKSFVETLPVEG